MVGWFAKSVLRLFGWKFEGELPPHDKLVVVGAPHTSNWDFVLMVLNTAMLRIEPSWMGKHTLFDGPLGPMFRAFGGIPIDRRSPHNAVDQLVAEFKRRKRLFLIITPEGTRSRTEHWKSGFYHIASGADVPIALAFADYSRKTVGIGPVISTSGDIERDMAGIAAFFEGAEGKFPEKFGPVRFRENDGGEGIV